MPLYEFTCDVCKREQELLLRLHDPVPHCPACTKPMRKLLSRSNFALKGDGWAKDNYGIKPAVKPAEGT